MIWDYAVCQLLLRVKEDFWGIPNLCLFNEDWQLVLQRLLACINNAAAAVQFTPPWDTALPWELSVPLSLGDCIWCPLGFRMTCAFPWNIKVEFLITGSEKLPSNSYKSQVLSFLLWHPLFKKKKSQQSGLFLFLYVPRYLHGYKAVEKSTPSASGGSSGAVVCRTGLWSLWDRTRVGLSVFLLFLTCVCPAARPKLQWWMIYSFPRQHIPYSYAPLLVPWKKSLVLATLLQFKPIDSYPISHGYEGQIILQQIYACLRTATTSFPELFFLHKLWPFM